MKPIILTISAFGPFAEVQTIDFEQLGNHKLFLITGETGAGKTMIFDALTFALYGKASGGNREPISFKSQHATISDTCYAELVFSLRDKIYTIYRAPLQEVLKRDGTSRYESESVKLTLPDGENIEGFHKVNAAIEDVIGLNHTQFKQTVMLAQGEFRKLLEANSTEKQKIFSQIFSTDQYASLTNRLVANTQGLTRNLETTREQIRHAVSELTKLGFEELDELGADAAFASLEKIEELTRPKITLETEQLERISSEIAAVEAQRDIINLEGARTLNATIAQYQSLKEKEGKLLTLAPHIAEQQILLDTLEKAKTLSALDQQVQESKHNITTQSEQISTLAAALAAAQEQYQIHTANHEMIPALEAKTKEIATKQQEVQQQLKAREEYASLQVSFEQAQKQQSTSAETIEHLQTARAKAKQQAQLTEQKELLTAAMEIQKQMASVVEYAKRQSLAKKQYDALYAQFLAGQASLLADCLADNTPCPVCGSLSHPLPAATDENVPSEEDVLQAQRNLQESDSALQHAQQTLNNQIGILQQKCPDTSLTSAEQMQSLEKELQDEVFSLEQQLSSSKSIPLAYQNKSLEQLAEEESLVHTEQGIAAERVRALSEQLDKLPPPTTEDLAAIAKDLSAEETVITVKITNYRKEYMESRSTTERLETESQSAQKHLAETQARWEELQSELTIQQQLAGFANAQEFQIYREQINEIPPLTATIKKHQQETAEVTGELRGLPEHIESQTPIDLKELEQKHALLTEQLAELSLAQRACHTFLVQTQGRLQEIKTFHQSSATLEEEFAISQDLSNLASGRRAPHISLERYVLAAYFDDILQVANIHLQQMTKNRYRLLRKEEKSQGTSGLDIEIMDAYNTSGPRDVGTLSGGEGFQTSLALALALSDVVQMYAGGVSINTMFIDEGFGSLDENALDNVMKTLVDLEQTGRMIGVISHVEQLRNFIPAKLVVERVQRGSQARFQIL